jgi:hypothetical protein
MVWEAFTDDDVEGGSTDDDIEGGSKDDPVHISDDRSTPLSDMDEDVADEGPSAAGCFEP